MVESTKQDRERTRAEVLAALEGGNNGTHRLATEAATSLRSAFALGDLLEHIREAAR